MNWVKQVQRSLLISKKRFSLLKYNALQRFSGGQLYDPSSEMNDSLQKSLNLLDFDANNDKDLFMLDEYSDRSEYGGLSETTLSIMKSPNDDFYCK